MRQKQLRISYCSVNEKVEKGTKLPKYWTPLRKSEKVQANVNSNSLQESQAARL